jgi:transcriptional regulator with XRE-family HTH domain
MTLRDLREEYELSRRQLAELAGIGYSTVVFYEQGRRRPEAGYLRLLARVLDERVFTCCRFGWRANPPTRRLRRSPWKCPGPCPTTRPRLHTLRLRAGLSQKELAQLARVGVNTVVDLESGKVLPRRSTLALLAEVLGPGVNNAEFGWRLCQPATNHP